MKNIAGQDHTLALSEVLGCRTLPRQVARTLEASAGGPNGHVSVEALVGMVVDEKRAADDRKLTRSIIIQLCVALIVLLAAFAGSIYMVVKLDNVVGNDNGIMVSRSTGQPLAVGSVSKISNAANLYEINNLGDLSKVKSVQVQLQGAGDGLGETAVFQVASAIVTPGQSALLTTTTGDQFESDSEGFGWVNSTSADAGGSRRKLMQESGMSLVSALTSSLLSIVITPDNPAEISCPSGVVVPDSCSTDKDCECGGTLTKCQSSKCQDVCLNQDDACSSDEQCSCWGEIFAFCDFDKGSVCRPAVPGAIGR
eukprot:jgi/Picre1/33219/NNA_008544.t1